MNYHHRQISIRKKIRIRIACVYILLWFGPFCFCQNSRNRASFFSFAYVCVCSICFCFAVIRSETKQKKNRLFVVVVVGDWEQSNIWNQSNVLAFSARELTFGLSLCIDSFKRLFVSFPFHQYWLAIVDLHHLKIKISNEF